MAAARYAYDDDYLMDDEMDEVVYDEQEEDSPSFFGMISDKVKGLFGRDSYENDDEYDDEDYDERAEEDEAPAPKNSYRKEEPSKRSFGFARRRASEPEAEEEPESSYESSSRSTNTRYGETEFTAEELDRFDMRFGTKNSSANAERKRSVRERMDPNSAARVQRRKKTSAKEWESYKGNVKKIKLAAPKNMDNVQEIASMLMDDYAAIICLKDMKRNDISTISYLDGVAYAIDYEFDQICGDYYICAPMGFMKPHEFGTYDIKRKK